MLEDGDSRASLREEEEKRPSLAISVVLEAADRIHSERALKIID